MLMLTGRLLFRSRDKYDDGMLAARRILIIISIICLADA